MLLQVRPQAFSYMHFWQIMKPQEQLQQKSNVPLQQTQTCSLLSFSFRALRPLRRSLPGKAALQTLVSSSLFRCLSTAPLPVK